MLGGAYLTYMKKCVPVPRSLSAPQWCFYQAVLC
jgi:hypothetical protein